MRIIRNRTSGAGVGGYMNFLYLLAAAFLSGLLIVVIASVVMLAGFVLEIRPEVLAFWGIVVIGVVCSFAIVEMGESQAKKNTRAVSMIIWSPFIIGSVASVFSIVFFPLGLWLSMTFAILNTWHHRWSKSHTGVEEV